MNAITLSSALPLCYLFSIVSIYIVICVCVCVWQFRNFVSIVCLFCPEWWPRINGHWNWAVTMKLSEINCSQVIECCETKRIFVALMLQNTHLESLMHREVLCSSPCDLLLLFLWFYGCRWTILWFWDMAFNFHPNNHIYWANKFHRI